MKRIAEQRVSSNQKRRFGVPSGLAMALAGVFALLTGNPETVRAHHTFRTLWNAVRGQLVPVCEAASSHSQSGGSKKSGSLVTTSHATPSRLTPFPKLVLTAAMAAAGFLPLTGTAANIESSGSYVASYDPDPDPDPDSGSDQPEDLHRHMELYLIIGHQDYSDVRQAKISLKRVKDYWTFDAEKLNSLIDSGWEGYSFIGPYLGFYAQVEGSDLKPELPTAYVIGHESAGFSQINGSFGTSHINAEEVHVNSGKTLGNFCKFDVGKRVQLSRAFLS